MSANGDDRIADEALKNKPSSAHPSAMMGGDVPMKGMTGRGRVTAGERYYRARYRLTPVLWGLGVFYLFAAVYAMYADSAPGDAGAWALIAVGLLLAAGQS